MVKYLEEFVKYTKDNSSTKQISPKERAELMFGFSAKKMLHILNALNIEDKKILAIKMVASGFSYLDVSCVLGCSSTTIKKWINDTFYILIREEK